MTTHDTVHCSTLESLRRKVGARLATEFTTRREAADNPACVPETVARRCV